MEPGAVEQNQAAPRKWLKQLRQCLLLLKLAQHEVEGRIQVARIDSVQRLADVVVAGQLADAEKRPAGVAVAGFLELSLVIEKRRRLHEEHRECGHRDVVKAVLGVGAVARVGQLPAQMAQVIDERIHHELHAVPLY